MNRLNLNDIQIAKKVRFPLGQPDILFLTEKFLSKGIHKLEINSFDDAHNLLQTFVKSLKFETVAFLSSHNCMQHNDFFNVKEFLETEYTNITEQELCNFFSDFFYFDFLWIELNKELSKQDWFDKFMSCFYDFNLIKRLTIIVVSIGSEKL